MSFADLKAKASDMSSLVGAAGQHQRKEIIRRRPYVETKCR